MKVKVDLETCIGCGMCLSVAEDVFVMEENIVTVNKEADFEENEEKIEEAVNVCPVGAISVEQ